MAIFFKLRLYDLGPSHSNSSNTSDKKGNGRLQVYAAGDELYYPLLVVYRLLLGLLIVPNDAKKWRWSSRDSVFYNRFSWTRL
jgi:hypothetical protein